jgi:hypothetical protein
MINNSNNINRINNNYKNKKKIKLSYFIGYLSDF